MPYLALNEECVRALLNWSPVTERLLTAHLKRAQDHINDIVSYAPTEVVDREAKDIAFVTCWIPYLTICNRNSNGEKLLHLARSWGLKIAGSWYRRRLTLRWTWYSRDQHRTKKELHVDHILINRRWNALIAA